MAGMQGGCARKGGALCRWAVVGLAVALAAAPSLAADKATLAVRAASVVIATQPTGLNVEVDGVTYTAPVRFNWPVGSQHVVAAPSPQGPLPWVRTYKFGKWSDGGEQKHTITVPPLGMKLVASFTTWYPLWTSMRPPDAGRIDIDPAPDPQGYYLAGTKVHLLAVPNRSHVFERWEPGPMPTGGTTAAAPANTAASILADPNLYIVMNCAQSWVAVCSRLRIVTLDTQPTGLKIVVDGESYQAPHTFVWPEGSRHAVAAPSPQPAGEEGSRYAFSFWQPVPRPPWHDGTYVAVFRKQFRLRLDAVPPWGGWIRVRPAGLTLVPTYQEGWIGPAGVAVYDFRLTNHTNIEQKVGLRAEIPDIVPTDTASIDVWPPLFIAYPKPESVVVGAGETVPVSLVVELSPLDDAVEPPQPPPFVADLVAEAALTSAVMPLRARARTVTWLWPPVDAVSSDDAPDPSTDESDAANRDLWFDAGIGLWLTAIPSSGFSFERWDGDLQGNANPALLTMDRPKKVAAVFSGSGVARIAVEPPRLDFGPVVLGRSRQLRFQIKNTGDVPVLIDGVLSSHECFAVLLPVACPWVIPVGGSLPAVAVFAPAEAKTYDEFLTVLGNAGNCPLDVPVTGTGTMALVKLPDARIVQGKTQSLNLDVVQSGGGSEWRLRIAHMPLVAKVASVGLTAMSRGASLSWRIEHTAIPEIDELVVRLRRVRPMTGDGPLLKVGFRAVGQPGSITPLHFSEATRDNAIVSTVDGSVTVVPRPTASQR